MVDFPNIRDLVLHDQDIDLDLIASTDLTLADVNVGLSAGGAAPLTDLGAVTFTGATSWNDGTFDRATIALDGTGLTLYDADGNVRLEARETALRIRAAVDQAEPILELLDEDGNQRWIVDPDGELTASVLDGINPAQQFFIDREDGFEMYSYNAGTKQASIQSSISSIGISWGTDLGMASDASIDMYSAGVVIGSGQGAGGGATFAAGGGFTFANTTQTGIAVDAAGIHAALVALGLITA